MAERIPTSEVERLLGEATPGPWHVGETDDNGEFYFAAGFVSVDHGEPDSWGDREHLMMGSRSEQSRRDVHLIAAAPELAADLLDARRAESRYRTALHRALNELCDLHQEASDVPWCQLCGAADGDWPCTSRLIADDLRAALSGEETSG